MHIFNTAYSSFSFISDRNIYSELDQCSLKITTGQFHWTADTRTHFIPSYALQMSTLRRQRIHVNRIVNYQTYCLFTLYYVTVGDKDVHSLAI